MIRVLIADDHTIVREGLKQLLLAAGDLEVVGEAQDGHEVMRQVRALDFDVLLLDMSMPGKSGIDLIKQVKAEKPKLRILVLSMHEEHQYAVRAIKAGASGYLTKESASTQLVSRDPQGRRGRRVHQRGSRGAAGAGRHAAGDDGPPHATLSDREYQVFQLLVSGKTRHGYRAAAQPVRQDGQHAQGAADGKAERGNQTELIHYAHQASARRRHRHAARLTLPRGRATPTRPQGGLTPDSGFPHTRDQARPMDGPRWCRYLAP